MPGPGERAEERIDLKSSADCAEVYAVPQPAGRLIGAVLDHTGKPVPKAQVYILRPGREIEFLVERSTETGPSGSFSIAGLSPGSYVVGVGVLDAPHATFPFVPVFHPGVTDRAAARAIEMAADTVYLPALKLGPPLRLTSISGELVCRDGTRPAAGKAWLSAKRLDDDRLLVPPDTSGPPIAGRYTVAVLPGHRYAVTGEVWVGVRFDDGVGYSAGPTSPTEVDSDHPPGVLRFVAPFDKCDAAAGVVLERMR